MAAITRMSVSIVALPPTRSNCFSCNNRSSLAWVPGAMSPTSSMNTVPPWACSNLPMRRRSAPVNAPRSWPNSSLSSSGSGMAAQLIARKGASAAAAVLIDRPGHQLLSRPAFAEDQHGHVLRGDAADRLVELLHRRRAAHQLVAFRLRLLLARDRSPARG